VVGFFFLLVLPLNILLNSAAFATATHIVHPLPCAPATTSERRGKPKPILYTMALTLRHYNSEGLAADSGQSGLRDIGIRSSMDDEEPDMSACSLESDSADDGDRSRQQAAPGSSPDEAPGASVVGWGYGKRWGK
jgi:hypothetical protein